MKRSDCIQIVVDYLGYRLNKIKYISSRNKKNQQHTSQPAKN